jgi:nucleoside-diphosphate-sugar epimerase
VVTESLDLHTEPMTSGTAATTFVTGAAGFIGIELVKILVSRGHPVFGLAQSARAVDSVRRAGGIPVVGDLLEPGPWQDEATAADWVFHLPPHPQPGTRVTRKRDAAATRGRLSMDAHLLDAVATGATRRIVYVTDASCYGTEGSRPITEDEPVQPSEWGRCLIPALERVEGYLVCGLPIVTALPGWVYGDGSWFFEYVVQPVMTGRRVFQFGKTGPLVSPIHIHDCARALVHLAEHGETGRRYFVVNSDPVFLNEFADVFARAAKRPLRVWPLPGAAAQYLLGRVLADYIQSNAVFSNVRLRGTGFRFVYPTLEQGVQQVLATMHERTG